MRSQLRKRNARTGVAGLGGYSERLQGPSSELPEKFVKTDIIRTPRNSWKDIEIL